MNRSVVVVMAACLTLLSTSASASPLVIGDIRGGWLNSDPLGVMVANSLGTDVNRIGANWLLGVGHELFSVNLLGVSADSGGLVLNILPSLQGSPNGGDIQARVQPVPEPASLCLLAIGLLLAARQIRQTRRKHTRRLTQRI
jgi:hypothetical protein